MICVLQMGNKGAFIRFEAPDLKPNIVTFSAVVSNSLFHVALPFSFSCYIRFDFFSPFLINLQPHPDVKPMAYANNFLRMFS